MTIAGKGVAGAAALTLAGSVCLLAQAASADSPKRLRNHFDTDRMFGVPGFFDFVELGAPGQAAWKVTAGLNPPSAPNVVKQVVAARPADSIAVAVRRNAVFRDGTLSLALERGAGQGGIVFRLADEKDFLVLLVDLSRGGARLTAYGKGRPSELASGKAPLGNDWGILSITATGPKIAATWNGKPLLEGVDPQPAPGRAGMATAGPGLVSFDEFVLEPGDS